MNECEKLGCSEQLKALRSENKVLRKDLVKLGLMYGEVLLLKERLLKASRKKEGVPSEVVKRLEEVAKELNRILKSLDDGQA